MSKYTTIRIEKSDLEKLRGICTKLFLEENPNMLGMKMTDTFMIKKVIDYYTR